MQHKRIVQIDIRTGRPRITITRMPGRTIHTYNATLQSFDRVVRVCTSHPKFGNWQDDGFDRWCAIER